MSAGCVALYSAGLTVQSAKFFKWGIKYEGVEYIMLKFSSWDKQRGGEGGDKYTIIWLDQLWSTSKLVYKFLSSPHTKYNSLVPIFNINTIEMALGKENTLFTQIFESKNWSWTLMLLFPSKKILCVFWRQSELVVRAAVKPPRNSALYMLPWTFTNSSFCLPWHVPACIKGNVCVYVSVFLLSFCFSCVRGHSPLWK